VHDADLKDYIEGLRDAARQRGAEDLAKEDFAEA
jgi:hypothetical protein